MLLEDHAALDEILGSGRRRYHEDFINCQIRVIRCYITLVNRDRLSKIDSGVWTTLAWKRDPIYLKELGGPDADKHKVRKPCDSPEQTDQ